MEFNVFIEKFAEAIEIENAESLNETTNFRELEEWSSLAVMLLVAFYDEEFGKQIGGAELRGCQTLQDLYKLAIE